MPSLFSFLPAANPAVPFSTIKDVMPRVFPFSPVRTITTATLPDLPCVIQDLVPLITQKSPSRVAVHIILAASEPVPGSVNPHAPIHSPVASLERYFFFCTSFPNSSICPEQSELCAAVDKPMLPQIFAISE